MGVSLSSEKGYQLGTRAINIEMAVWGEVVFAD
jgi:hypothetical protein